MLTFQMALILCAYDEKQYTLVMYTKHAMNIRKKKPYPNANFWVNERVDLSVMYTSDNPIILSPVNNYIIAKFVIISVYFCLKK